MATLPDDLVTMEQLCEAATEILGEDVPSTSLSGPLRVLREDARHGKLLADVKSQTGDRVYNYTRFADPGMKAFIKMRIRADAAT